LHAFGFAGPSTYAGLGLLRVAGGVHIDNSILQAVIVLLVAITGLASVLTPAKAVSY
jgi:hypothetical protein